MAKPKEFQDMKLKGRVFWGAFFGAIAGYVTVVVILMVIAYLRQ